MMNIHPVIRNSDVTKGLCLYRDITRYLYVFLTFVILTILIPASPVRAEEDPDQTYSPRYSLGIGYSWSSLDGSRRAIEYRSGIKSPALKGGIEVYHLPHRFYLDFSTYEKDDLYLDTGYAYKEVMLSRLIMRELLHNLDHYRLPDLNPDEVKRKYNDRDIEGKYQADIMISDFFLRLKSPDYPVHLYTRYFRYDKKGEIQQRFLIGTFNDMTVTSQGRQIDFRTEELTIGSNGHFGPVEIEYSHGEKNFVPGGNTVLADLYPANSLRPEDVYPHNRIPETRTSSDYIKVHSSYTGRITASASVGSVRQSNQDSSVKRDIIVGAGQLSYIAMDELSFFLRFSYRDMDEDAPATTVLKGLSNELTYEVRPALDVRRRKVSLDVRARPLRGINLTGSYSVSRKDRSDTEEWLLVNRNTTVNTLTLKVYGTLLKGVKFRTRYKYSDLKNPVYNTEPDLSHELNFYTSYSPFPGVLTVLTYNLKKDMRDNLRFIDNATDIPLEAGQRNNTTNNILGLIMLTPGEKTSLTLGCGYYRNNPRQTLMYSTFSGDGSSTPGNAIIENGVPYSDESTSYSIGITHRINDRTDISADMGQTHSKGKFRTSNPLSENIDSFSMLKVTETALSIRCSYAIINGFGIETMLGLRDYNDRIDDYNDGRFYQAILILTKRW
ncbi:MAG: outer membrane channel lipoprotein [bacterium]|nr:MAG: outer membrane channel lipoprotein [bacterium]